MARAHPPALLKGEAASHPLADLARLMPKLASGARVAVALSAGMDSAALLIAAVLSHGPDRVLAIHVNHGLQEAANDFESEAARQCQALGCALAIVAVDATPARGQSPEEAARDARYLALAKAALEGGASVCLLAHHANDQAETLALALSRGLGLLGLAGMGSSFERHGQAFARPWLSTPRAKIAQAMAAAHAAWAEDPSNQDERFARNMARKKAMPGLLEAFPGFLDSCSRSMAHCASAQLILDEVAAEDVARLHMESGSLSLKALRELSAPRMANALRHWLLSRHGQRPTQAQTDEAREQILSSARGGAIDIKCGNGKLVRREDALAFLDEPAHKPAGLAP